MTLRAGWIMALSAVLLYSTNTPIARGAILAGMEPTTLLAARFGLTAILFALTPSFIRPNLDAEADNRPLDRRGWWIAVASGIGNGLTLFFFYWALTMLNASIASMLVISLYPIFTLFILSFYGEPFTGRKIMRLLLSLGGLYLLIGPGGDVNLTGVLLATIGAVMFAVHLVSVQWYLRPYATWPTTSLMVSGAAVVVAGLWVWEGMDTFVPGWIGWAAIFVQAVLATYIGRLVTYAAINIIGSAQFALLSPLETLLTLLWSVLFLDERLSLLQSVGAVFIIAGLVLAIEWLTADWVRQKLKRIRAT